MQVGKRCVNCVAELENYVTSKAIKLSVLWFSGSLVLYSVFLC